MTSVGPIVSSSTPKRKRKRKRKHSGIQLGYFKDAARAVREAGITLSKSDEAVLIGQKMESKFVTDDVMCTSDSSRIVTVERDGVIKNCANSIGTVQWPECRTLWISSKTWGWGKGGTYTSGFLAKQEQRAERLWRPAKRWCPNL